MSYAGLFDTGPGPLQAFRDALGIEGSVLAPGSIEFASRALLPSPLSALESAPECAAASNRRPLHDHKASAFEVFH